MESITSNDDRKCIQDYTNSDREKNMKVIASPFAEKSGNPKNDP